MNAAMTCSDADRRYAQAVVLTRNGKRVELAVSRQSACTACSHNHGCGSKQDAGRAQRIWLETDIPLKTGETVAVAMPDQAVWHAALLMYGLPLAGFVVGLLLGALQDEPMAMLGAAMGLLGGFVLAGLLARRVSASLELFQQAPVPPSMGKGRNQP